MTSDSTPAFEIGKEALKTEIETGIQAGVDHLEAKTAKRKDADKYHTAATRCHAFCWSLSSDKPLFNVKGSGTSSDCFWGCHLDHCFYDEMKPIPTNLKIPEEIEMRALLRDAQDQTRIALEVEEVVYDPKDNKLFLYTTSETCYAVSKVVRANADSIIEELVMKGYSDLTQFESEQDE